MDKITPKTSAHLLMLAGAFFLIAAVIGLVTGQFVLLAFFGVAAMFLGVGASQLLRLRKPEPSP